MSAPIPLRRDFGASQLRGLAKKTKDGPQARRLLALAAEQIVILHRRLLAIVRDDEVCRRLMTTPGVGPVVALTYRATVDVPAADQEQRIEVVPALLYPAFRRKGR